MVWIIGDDFVENSVEQYFMKMPEDDSYTKQHYDVKYVASAYAKSNHKSTIGRLRNNVAFAIKNFVNLPKIIVVILEEDVIKRITQNKNLKYLYDRYIKWLSNEIRKMIMTQNDFLPKKGQRDPQILLVKPTQHVNYKNNAKRQLFGDSLTDQTDSLLHNCVLQLKQEWDPEDLGLYLHEQQRFTSPGLYNFWRAIDRTIKFCSAVLNANSSKANERFYLYTYGTKEETSPEAGAEQHAKAEPTETQYGTYRGRGFQRHPWTRPYFRRAGRGRFHRPPFNQQSGTYYYNY